MLVQIVGTTLGAVLFSIAVSSKADELAQKDGGEFSSHKLSADRAGPFEVTVSALGAIRLLPKYHLPGYRLSVSGEDKTGSQRPVLLGAAQTFELTYRFDHDPPLLPWGSDARVSVAIEHARAFGELASRERSPPGLFHGVTVDGRVGFHLASVSLFRSRRWYFRHRRLETNVRFASDFDAGYGIRVTPSLFVLGGVSRELYQHRVHSLDINGASFIGLPYALDQSMTSVRIGTGVGVSVAVPLVANVALTLSGDLAVYWVGARLRSSDCVRGGAGTDCGVPPGTFQPGSSYATSSSDTEVTVGLRTKVSLELSRRYNWGSFRLSGFLRWNSAVPGIENPASPSSAALGSFVGTSRVKFDPTWSAGAMVGISIPLN